eukprot:TRINITY_DN3552_c0_g2_i1.p1 TRINITY_DN3552_c0_g2~~TRINITY_DN3552_c0_g2_i1.p1  ORF type:complete len:235 (-),score=42.61 TRINITY_DN3552_c0_g2_i1:90-758(-)
MDKGKVSSGFLIESDGLFLLAHATQRKDDPNIKQFDGQWTVIKGELDANETVWQAAVRRAREMDKGKVSSGFLIESDGLFLLAHATQRKDDPNIKQFDGQWTVIKGELDANETVWQAAVRELKEEASLDLIEMFPSLVPTDTETPNFSYKTGRGKQVYLFWINDTMGLIKNANIEFKCTSILHGMPPKLAHRTGAPEVDAFMWVTKEEAVKMVFPSLRFLFK